MKFSKFTKIIFILSALAITINCRPDAKVDEESTPSDIPSTKDPNFLTKMKTRVEEYWKNTNKLEFAKCMVTSGEYFITQRSHILSVILDVKGKIDTQTNTKIFIDKKTFSIAGKKGPSVSEEQCNGEYINNFFDNCLNNIAPDDGENEVPKSIPQNETEEPSEAEENPGVWSKIKSYAHKSMDSLKTVYSLSKEDIKDELESWKNSNKKEEEISQEFDKIQKSISQNTESKTGLLRTFMKVFSNSKRYFNCGYKQALVTLNCLVSYDNLHKIVFSISKRMIVYMFFYGILTKYRLMKVFYRFMKQVYKMTYSKKDLTTPSCELGKLTGILADGIYTALGLVSSKKRMLK